MDKQFSSILHKPKDIFICHDSIHCTDLRKNDVYGYIMEIQGQLNRENIEISLRIVVIIRLFLTLIYVLFHSNV